MMALTKTSSVDITNYISPQDDLEINLCCSFMFYHFISTVGALVVVTV